MTYYDNGLRIEDRRTAPSPDCGHDWHRATGGSTSISLYRIYECDECGGRRREPVLRTATNGVAMPSMVWRIGDDVIEVGASVDDSADLEEFWSAITTIDGNTDGLPRPSEGRATDARWSVSHRETRQP